MFERFTMQAREAVRVAQAEAREMRHPALGTEHLLLGLLAAPGPASTALHAAGLTAAGVRQRLLALEDDGLDPAALATLGIDFERVKATTEAHLGPGALDKPKGPPKTGHLPVTKRVKKVLELSLREAVHLQSGEIGSGHLLLGLLRDGDGMAIALLRDARVDLAALRTEVTTIIEARAA